jgi:hypothetical protein
LSLPYAERAAHLEQAVYELPPHVFLVGAEELALEQAVCAFRDAVVGLEVLGYPRSTLRAGRCVDIGGHTLVAGGDVEIRAQGVVYDLVVLDLAARRDNVVELCGRISGAVVVGCACRGRGVHSPSQNCCSFSRLYDTSNAMLGSRVSHQTHPHQRVRAKTLWL